MLPVIIHRNPHEGDRPPEAASGELRKFANPKLRKVVSARMPTEGSGPGPSYDGPTGLS